MKRSLLLCCLLPALASGANSRIDVTGGVGTIEGAAGGGLVPWALVAGHGARGEIGGSVVASRAEVDDYGLEVLGAAVAAGDRLEVSFARQWLDVEPLSTRISQDVVGVKVRVAGRLPYTRMPQIAVGAQYKRNRDFDGLPSALGGAREDDVDFYVAGTKLWFAALAGRNVLANLTLRSSRAHETGFLGFGGEREIRAEASLGLFLRDDLVLGTEWRQKPGGLPGLEESDWRDVYLAWFPVRNLSVTAAWLDLGDVVVFDDQSGWYLSLEASL